MSYGQAPSSKSPPSKAAAAAVAAVSPSPQKKKKAKTLKDGDLSSFFEEQLTVEAGKCAHVITHAPAHEPRGIKWLYHNEKKTLDKVKEALAAKNYVVAKEQKEQLDSLRSNIGKEEKLLSYYNIKKCYFAAAAFNPMEAMAMDQAAIEACIKDLKHFCFDEFREINGILDDAISEIPACMACLHATTDELLSSLPCAAEYDEKLQKDAAKDPSKEGKTWKDDHIEVARRAWEWWRLHRDKFVCLSIAVRLIVLVQVSSASVERVFLQLKLIIDAIGVSALKDNVECRLFERLNKYPPTDA